jgi:hypothetical protein
MTRRSIDQQFFRFRGRLRAKNGSTGKIKKSRLLRQLEVRPCHWSVTGVPTETPKRISLMASHDNLSFVEANATMDFEVCQLDVCSEFELESREGERGVPDDAPEDN